MLIRRDFILKPRERNYVPLETVQGNFQIVLRLRDRHMSMWQSIEILDVFDT